MLRVIKHYIKPINVIYSLQLKNYFCYHILYWQVEENDFRKHYEKFKIILEEVIDRNINKRMFIHLRYT